MTYAALMVQTDGSRPSAARTRLSVELALKFDAFLIGVAGIPEPAPHAAQGELRDIDSRLKKAESGFRSSAGGVRNIDWRSGIDFPGEIILREAHMADLIIVEKGMLHGAADTGVILLKAGRPVLVVPHDVDHLSAHRVIVAWKDTSEARRVVRDAIPFLKRAKEVILVGFGEGGSIPALKDQLGDVTNYLLRHRVTVTGKVCRHVDGAVGKELLQVARDEGSDLLVAGAYGHSRLGEWVFGGVTRDLLADSLICCFFSH
jgi:nucleotide-binding universal stress UspA family protein